MNDVMRFLDLSWLHTAQDSNEQAEQSEGNNFDETLNHEHAEDWTQHCITEWTVILRNASMFQGANDRHKYNSRKRGMRLTLRPLMNKR